MSVTQTPAMTFGAVETVAIDGAGNVKFSFAEFDFPATTFTGTTSVPVANVASDKLALTAGAATIDLTAVPGSVSTQDLTGLKVQWIMLHNSGTAVMTISPGATNPYPLFGTGNSVELPAGGRLMMFFNETLPDVAAAVKDIDIAGTGTDVLNYVISAG